MNAETCPAASLPAATGSLLSREFLVRASLAFGLVILAHELDWQGLRFLTSEIILRISSGLGMFTCRTSFDTICVQAEFFQYATACTFVDVFAGSIPLLWDLKKSVGRNFARLTAAAVLLFCFNILRLEVGQIVHARGVPWTVADAVLGGLAYFAVALALWRLRAWSS